VENEVVEDTEVKMGEDAKVTLKNAVEVLTAAINQNSKVRAEEGKNAPNLLEQAADEEEKVD